MTQFEQVLEACLSDLEQGASNVDECLARHPEYAAQLQPILLLTDSLEHGRTVEPSPAFKARARAKLTLHMQAHPRTARRASFAFWRLATGFAMLVLVLLSTGTVYAQHALPGDLFYGWKRSSERIWRAVSLAPIETDLKIAHRRLDEMNAVANDSVRRELAAEGYQEVLVRLRSELDAETLDQILPKVEIEVIPIENPEQAIPTLPTLLPERTAISLPVLPAQVTVTPRAKNTHAPLPELPKVPPTKLVPHIPTMPNVPPELPEIVPTVRIPPPFP